MQEDKGGNTISCPDSGAWLELAAGLKAPGERDSLLRHAAWCSSCALALRNALRVMEPESSPEEDAMLQTLQSSKPEWQKWTAADLARQARKHRGNAAGWRDRRYLAAAAVVVMAAGLGYWFWREQQPPLTLLAQAYTEQRTIELRIPGAAYGPMRVERGGAADRPAELSESEAAIRRRLDAKPEDAAWLRAKGRAELLEWRYEEAIQSLRLALDVDAEASPRAKAETLTDLGTAYFERAEKENRPIDYSMAAEQLGKAIQLNDQLAAAYYNRAIVYERMFLYPNAVEDWKRYLQLDPHGPWAADAAARLKTLQERMRAAAPTPDRLADLAEVQLDNAMRSGLKAAGVKQTATLLRDQNGDRWLADALAEGPSELTDVLSGMVDSRSKNRIDLFAAEVLRLGGLSENPAPPAHRLWLEYEKLWRMSHSPDVAKYANSFEGVLAECRSRQYSWFLTHLLLERASCQWVAGDRNPAGLLEAKELAAAHRFPIAGQRAAGFITDRLTSEGSYRDAARLAGEELRLFWSRPFPVARRLEFYNQSERAYGSLGRWHAAAAEAESAAETAGELDLIANEAILRARWADDAEHSGSTQEAADQYTRATALFKKLRPTPATDDYRAVAEAATGDWISLSTANSASVLQNSTNPFLIAPYLRAMATLDERNHDRRAAQALLEEALTRIERRAVAGNLDQSRPWRSEMQRDYRELTRIQAAQGDVQAAYSTWRRFLRADAEIRGWRAAQQGGLMSGERATLITFARLHDRYAVWRDAGGTPEFHWAASSADSIDALARRYSALCAQPRAPWTIIQHSGARLTAALFGTSLRGMPRHGILLVQPDGDLGRLPWASLPLATGEILGERFSVAVVLERAANEAPQFVSAPVHRTLIVGATLPSNPNYLPLPGIRDEIAAIQAAIPGASVLEGPAANVANIEQALGDADGLHFAGHAIASTDGIRLLVAPDRRSADKSAQDGFWTPPMRGVQRLNLVVLSACSTGRYEDEDSLDPNDLARALLIHGARQVMAALWNTDSQASSRFMQVFYANVGQGRTAVQAARAALSDVRRHPGWENPYYWAPFTLFAHS